MELLREVRRALGQPAYAGGGEGRQVDASCPALAGQLAESHPQGVGRGERVVAERDHQQHRQVAEAASQEAEQVEGRVVGPLHVLDDEDHEAVGVLEPAQGGVEHLVAGQAGADGLEQRHRPPIGRRRAAGRAVAG